MYKAHTSTEEGIACHRKKGLSGAFGAEKTDCDSPLSLVNATFDWIRDHVKDDVDFIIWTGDTARHDSDEKNPRDTDSVFRTNRLVADRFVDAIAGNSGKLDIPIVPTFGNNDFLPHNIFYPGPNKWLHAYSEIWRRFIPEEQRHSFEYGGWFQIEVIPGRLAVISLNTMYFFDRNAAVDGCRNPSEPGFRHMDWLRIQLQLLRERGMKAILMGHVPPARTEGKQAWDETCWQRYTLWLKQYRDVVTGSVYGHMNIDHFMLQDTKEIDILSSAATMSEEEDLDKDPLDEVVEVQSKGDYLSELRNVWSGLPSAAVEKLITADAEPDEVSSSRKGHKKKGRKYKKIGGKYAERYQLTLVSPSVVPNYFPTLRVVEYNISGLEDAKTWEDPFSASSVSGSSEHDLTQLAEELHQELKRDAETDTHALGKKGKKHKKKKGRKGKKKPHDPNLIVPEKPSKKSLPGPAYKMQPFTFTGYTQYFANLTHINNDLKESDAHSAGWRDGDHDNKNPGHKPKPREFKYEVEYSTYDDKLFKLDDLTVKSYLKLAYRMAKKGRGKASVAHESDVDVHLDDDDFYDDYEEDEDEGDDNEDEGEEVNVAGKGGKKKHKKKNKVWLHFLHHAFVKTATDKELKKL